MENNVLISVKTIQNIQGEEEAMELITEGKFYKEGDSYIAVYDETEISGMEGTTTTLKIDNDALSIVRRGTTNSDLFFQKGLKHVSIYTTPFGNLEIIIKPSNMVIDVNENGGNLKLEYRMETIGADPIENELELNIREVN